MMSPQNGWSNWAVWAKNALVGGFMVLSFALYAALIVRAAGDFPLSPLEAASLALVGTVVSAVLGVILGVPLGRKTVNVASQLRRAHGIQQSLRIVVESIAEADRRNRIRGRSDPALIAEVWRELVQHIDAQLRGAILEAGRIVEDWGDLAPSEREAIAVAEGDRNAAIIQYRKQLQETEAVANQLAGSRSAQRLATAAAALETGIRDLRSAPASPRAVEAYKRGTARQLLESGAYLEAVRAYDRVVERYPQIYTNYLQRARARALAGDLVGAESDLALARTLAPPFASGEIEHVRLSITEVTKPQTAFPGLVAEAEVPRGPYGGGGKDILSSHLPRHVVAEGNKTLARGDGLKALGLYARLEDSDWSPVYTNINIAMAACVGGDFGTARERLDRMKVTFTSGVGISVLATRAIVDALEATEDLDQLAELKECVNRFVGGYQISKSPLRFLEAGLRATGKLTPAVQRVFDVVRGEHPPPSLTLPAVPERPVPVA